MGLKISGLRSVFEKLRFGDEYNSIDRIPNHKYEISFSNVLGVG